jgi:imidazolonepropionase-like amidohydrolase
MEAAMKTWIVWMIWLLVVSVPACAASRSYATPELYSGFTLVDPQTQTETPNAWLVVDDGRIAKVGKGGAPQGPFAAAHDMTGLYALPGMVDAHAHVVTGPFEVKVENGKPVIGEAAADKYTRFNAAIALAFGITTLRNPGGSTEAAGHYDRMRATGQWVGPRALNAGAVIEPPPLGGESFAYPRTPAEWDAEAARQKAAGMTYFKLYKDLTEAELAEGVRVARAHGLIPIAHLEQASWAKAANLGVQQIEHILPISADLLEPAPRAAYAPNTPPSHGYYQWFELADYDGPLIRGMIRTLVAKGVVVTPTLLVEDIVYHADDLSGIFPPGDLQDYQPESFASAKANYDALAKLWTPDDFKRARAAWPKVLRFVKLLHDSGVKLMIGTDGTGGAPVYARELHDMAEAGIPAWEVLRMATSGNAGLMGLKDSGRIAPGLRADVVFLRADPVQDVRNVRQVEWVVAAGKPYRSADLVSLAQGFAH